MYTLALLRSRQKLIRYKPASQPQKGLANFRKMSYSIHIWGQLLSLMFIHVCTGQPHIHLVKLQSTSYVSCSGVRVSLIQWAKDDFRLSFTSLCQTLLANPYQLGPKNRFSLEPLQIQLHYLLLDLVSNTRAAVTPNPTDPIRHSAPIILRYYPVVSHYF